MKNVVLKIDLNIEEVGNIASMANESGIREAKLREGFQILLNNTIHSYIQRTHHEIIDKN